jgi:hypothetical protein
LNSGLEHENWIGLSSSLGLESLKVLDTRNWSELRSVKHDYNIIDIHVSVFTPRETPYKYYSTPKLDMPTPLMG